MRAAIDGDSSSLTGAYETPIDFSSHTIDDEEIIAKGLMAGVGGLLLGSIVGAPAGPVGVVLGGALGAFGLTAFAGAELVAKDKKMRSVKQRHRAESDS